jgi:hypothetical protein
VAPGGTKNRGSFANGVEEVGVIREFVGFEAYEAACGRDLGLLGFSPIDTALWLEIALQDVLRAVEDGFLDLCRVVNGDGSVLLVVPLASIRQFRFPYPVETWKRRRKYRPKSWQLLMLQADRQRGAWQYGLAMGCS